MPFVNVATDLGPCVEALVLRVKPQTTLIVAGESMHYEDYVRRWAEIMGVKLTVNRVTTEDLIKTMPEGLGIESGQMMEYITEFGWDGGAGALYPQDIGVELPDIATYIRNTDWTRIDAELVPKN
jgi:hypothetical protein